MNTIKHPFLLARRLAWHLLCGSRFAGFIRVHPGDSPASGLESETRSYHACSSAVSPFDVIGTIIRTRRMGFVFIHVFSDLDKTMATSPVGSPLPRYTRTQPPMSVTLIANRGSLMVDSPVTSLYDQQRTAECQCHDSSPPFTPVSLLLITVARALPAFLPASSFCRRPTNLRPAESSRCPVLADPGQGVASFLHDSVCTGPGFPGSPC